MPTRPKIAAPRDPRPLPEACVDEAIAVIATGGVEALSLREVARRLGVSHQAPYRHFPSRDHLLAEVIRRCLRRFGAALRDGVAGASTPEAAMERLAGAYLAYAAAHPLEYRLMFGTPWPEAAQVPDLRPDARAAFDVLRERLAALLPGVAPEALDLDALFVWSAIHGLAGVIESEAMRHLDFDAAKTATAVRHAMAMIDRALNARRSEALRAQPTT
jgi:AcrR family transcriptional regulator